MDTSVHFATANAEAGIRAGPANMGYSDNEAYNWVTDKQYGCQNCHTFSRPERNLK